MRSLGGNLLLIQSLSEKPTKEALDEFDEWVAFWFEWTRPWNCLDVNLNRTVWTRWYGVPLHAWNTNFFSMVCAKVGLFLKMDSIDEQKLYVNAARVLLSATCLTKIDKVMQVNIDGISYSIRVVEEEICQCILNPQLLDSTDEESMSGESNGSLESEYPAEAVAEGDSDGSTSSEVSWDGKNDSMHVSKENVIIRATPNSNLVDNNPDKVNGDGESNFERVSEIPETPQGIQHSKSPASISLVGQGKELDDGPFEGELGPCAEKSRKEVEILHKPAEEPGLTEREKIIGPQLVLNGLETNLGENLPDSSESGNPEKTNSASLVLGENNTINSSEEIGISAPYPIETTANLLDQQSLQGKTPDCDNPLIVSQAYEAKSDEKGMTGNSQACPGSRNGILGKGRKKGKGTIKSMAYRKEKRKWANFMRGIASEEEIQKEETRNTTGSSKVVEDEVSEHIRNEAIRTWNAGKQLGIQSMCSEKEIIESLADSDKDESQTVKKCEEILPKVN